MKTRRYLQRRRALAPERVIVVILTDGLENASRHWPRTRVLELIAEAEEMGWQFVFLGANQESWKTSRLLGIQRGAVVDWSPRASSFSRAMSEASAASVDFRRQGVAQRRYRDCRRW